MSKNKKNITLIAGAIVVLLLIMAGATYAYFVAQAGSGTGTSINATTGTTDSLSFSVGKDIEIKATLDNFYEGHESLNGSTTATATLKANNTTNSATARYNLFFIIDQNDFEYSTEDGQTELLMKVTDPNGNEVMDITGLKRVEGGFDVTTRTGGFLIMADYDIEATPTETTKAQTWNLEITFVNLEENQNVNKGKTFNGRFYITKEQESTYELAEINNIEAIPAYNSVTANLTSVPGTEEIAKYYYAIEEDTTDMAYIGAGVSVARLSNNLAITDSDYIESDQPTHTFTNLKPSTKYKVYSYAKDIYGVKSNVYETSITTEDYELARVTNLTQSVTLNSITVTATAEGGSNAVSKYFFSKDNGATWSEGQESNTYTFNDLLDTTEYKIKVKVIDTNDVYSTEYAKTIATTTYNNPSITTVNATKTYNSISLTTTAAGGTNSVAKYYYKIDDGSWSAAQTTNTYNITSGLAENTTYTIYVKVEDTIGRMSNEYSLDVTTDTYVIPTINVTATSSAPSTTKSSITINATATKGDGNIAKYMYSKDGGSNWITQNSTATTDSYTFENLTPGATFQIRVKVVDSNNRESTVYSASATANYYALATYIKGLYTSQGANGLYYHNTSLTNGAGDNSYRYAGANPNNFVCFGSNEYKCPEDNLYRIIGVFDNQVKLIKYDYASADDLGLESEGDAESSSWSNYKGNKTTIPTYKWGYNYGNVWTNSPLKNALNTSYLTIMGSDWANKITTTIWHIGGLNASIAEKTNAKNVYDHELGSSKVNEPYEAKVGLVYLSEYFYAASPTYWTYKGYDTATTDYRAATSNNWMYMGMSEWTISRVNSSALAYVPSSSITRLSNTLAITAYAHSIYPIYTSGNIDRNTASSTNPVNNIGRITLAVRPTFNLSNDVGYASGTGSKTDPYRLEKAEEPEEITFKIGNNEYTALKGMTWQEWVNSDYDKSYQTNSWTINDNKVYCMHIGSNYVKDPSTDKDVSPNEVIKSGYEYAVYTIGCFAEDTLIYTVNGYKNIQDINVGDKVYSYNEKTKRVEMDTVTQTFEHIVNAIYLVTLEDRTILKITPNHPVYDKKTQSWKAIEEFKVGDILTIDTGKEIKIASMELLNEEMKVYNIEVSQNHNYFVTDKNILVHNKAINPDV